MHWKDWCWSWSSNTLATWCEEPTHWKRLWCWERLRAGGEEGDRGWDGWMASLTQWAWVWAKSRRQWSGKPGVLQSMGWQCWTQLGHKTTTTASNIMCPLPCVYSLIYHLPLGQPSDCICCSSFNAYILMAHTNIKKSCLPIFLLVAGQGAQKIPWNTPCHHQGCRNCKRGNSSTWHCLFSFYHSRMLQVQHLEIFLTQLPSGLKNWV